MHRPSSSGVPKARKPEAGNKSRGSGLGPKAPKHRGSAGSKRRER